MDEFTNFTNFSNNGTNSFDDLDFLGPKRDNLYIVIPITIIYVIIFMTGLIGNVSTCIVIARNKSMHTATNYYLVSLAISDLLLLLFGLPPEIYSIWSRYPYVFGYTFCVLRGLFAETSANATVLTITAFTVERYVAICHPFLSHTMSKLTRVVKLILVIWCTAICFAIPQALQFGLTIQNENPDTVGCHVINPIVYSFEISTFLFFILPMTLITVLYAMIGFRLKFSSMVRRESQMQQRLSIRQQQGQSSRRVLKMLVAVVVAFFICWAPFHAQRLIAIYTNAEDNSKYLKVYEVVTYISGILYFVSTTINPVLYNIMSNKFRDAFKETFARCCGLERLQSGRPQRSYSVLSRAAQRATESMEFDKDDSSMHTHTTVIHKGSDDSVSFCPNGGKRTSRKKKDADGRKRERAEVCVTMVSKTNLDNISPNTCLVTVHVPSPPPRKADRFARLWNWIKFEPHANRRKRSTDNLEMRKSPNIDTFPTRKDSLKDIDSDLFEDELSVYLQDMQIKE